MTKTPLYIEYYNFTLILKKKKNLIIKNFYQTCGMQIYRGCHLPQLNLT